MKYLFPAIFLFSIILTGCSNVKETIVNSNNFHLREGFRDRLFDNRHTYSIAVWIEAKNEYMKNVKALKFIFNNKVVYTDTALINHCYANGENSLDYFYQYFISDTNLLKAHTVIELETSNQVFVFNDFQNSILEGRPKIAEFDSSSHSLAKKQITLNFKELEKGFDYDFQIYGPKNSFTNFSLYGNSIELNLENFQNETNLMCIIKRNKLNWCNVISREYSIILE